MFLKFILILFSHLRPGFSNGPFLSGFSTKILSPTRITCLVSLIIRDLVNRTAERLLTNADLVKVPQRAVSSWTSASDPIRRPLCRINPPPLPPRPPTTRAHNKLLLVSPTPVLTIYISMAFEGLPLNLRPFKPTELTYVYDKHFFGIFYLFTTLRLY